MAQEVRRPHRDRGHPPQAPGARECPLEGAARRSGARARGAEGDQRKKMERVAVRRAQVRYAMTRRLSCRRACVLLRVARSALGYAARRRARDAAPVAELQRLAAAHPRYGYRRMWALLRRRGRAVNPKRVHCLWRGAGLALPRRRVRRKVRTGARVRPLADRPNSVWTYDLIHDACTDGTHFKCLTVVDEFTKECLAITVARSLPGDRVLPASRSWWPAAVRRTICAATTGRNSSPGGSSGGSRGRVSRRPTLTPASRGRMEWARAFTAASGTSVSTRKRSLPCTKRRASSSSTAAPTTTPDHTSAYTTTPPPRALNAVLD